MDNARKETLDRIVEKAFSASVEQLEEAIEISYAALAEAANITLNTNAISLTTEVTDHVTELGIYLTYWRFMHAHLPRATYASVGMMEQTIAQVTEDVPEDYAYAQMSVWQALYEWANTYED